MVTVNELTEKHKSTARTWFNSSGGVMSQIDDKLVNGWVRGNPVTFSLEEVYAKPDARVAPFMVDLIISNYGGESGSWEVCCENNVFLFKAKVLPAAT